MRKPVQSMLGRQCRETCTLRSSRFGQRISIHLHWTSYIPTSNSPPPTFFFFFYRRTQRLNHSSFSRFKVQREYKKKAFAGYTTGPSSLAGSDWLSSARWLQYVSVIEWPDITIYRVLWLTKIKIKTSKRHTKYHYIQCISAVVIYRI